MAKVKIAKGYKNNDEVIYNLGDISKRNFSKPVIIWENKKGRQITYGYNFESIRKFKLGKKYKGFAGNEKEINYTCRVVAIIKP